MYTSDITSTLLLEMNYKYNIKHKVNGKAETINFKNKKSMLTYLNKNKDKINKLMTPALHFNTIVLPLKQTVWFNHEK